MSHFDRRRHVRYGPQVRIAIRVAIAALAPLGGWLVGGLIGLLVGLGIDAASPDEAFVSAALMTIGLGGLMGLVVGGWVGARVLVSNRPSH